MKKLLSVLIIYSLSGLSGCVLKSTYLADAAYHKQRLQRLQLECDQASEKYRSKINYLEQEIRLKNERLMKFNQLDQERNLRNNRNKRF